MGPKSKKIMKFMLAELSKLKYAHRVTIEGCFDDTIMYYAYQEPEDRKEDIVDEVLRILNEIYA